MKNMFLMAGCCLLSAVAFASATLPEKPADSQLAATLGQGLTASHDAVLICHKGRGITVDAHAVPAHLAHGDKLGSCTSTSPGDVDAQ